MKLLLKRLHYTPNSIIGELSIDGKFECYTLEDIERDVKVMGKTAIPKGSYNVTITYSNRFKRDMPLLMNVPNFSGVRIHNGNTAADTDGCVLVGKTRAVDFIGNSKLAYTALFNKMKKVNGDNFTITIE